MEVLLSKVIDLQNETSIVIGKELENLKKQNQNQPIKSSTLSLKNKILTKSEVYCLLSYNLNGTNVLISGGWNGEISIWGLNDYKLLFQLKEHLKCISSLLQVFVDDKGSSDKQLLASSSYDGSIIIWDLNTKKAIFNLNEHKSPVYSLALVKIDNNNISSDDCKFALASGSADYSIIVWDLSKRKSFFQLKEHTKTVYVLTTIIIDNKETLVSGSYDGTILIWDLETKKSIYQIKEYDKYPIKALITIIIDNNQALAIASNNSILIWDVSSKKFIFQLSDNTFIIYTLSTITIDNIQLLASGGEDNSILLWDLSTKKIVLKLKEHDNWIYTIISKTNNEGKQSLYSGSRDCTIKIFS